MVKHVDQGPCENDQDPHQEQVESRRRIVGRQEVQDSGDYRRQRGTDIDVALAPEAVDYHPQSVQAAPDHEIPACPVPKASQ